MTNSPEHLKPNFTLPPSKSSTAYYDALRKLYGGSIQQKSCTTCKYFELEFGIHPICLVGKKPKYLELTEKLDSFPACARRSSSSYSDWSISKVFSVNHQIDLYAELNKDRNSDYYEVYEHFTGETREVQDGWFRVKEEKVKFFYILKNGVGYYCSGEWDRVLKDYKTGFIPLDDFKEVTSILKKYESAGEAIAQCELFNSWGNPNGNLIYSTGDSLEARFRALEKKKSTKPNKLP